MPVTVPGAFRALSSLYTEGNAFEITVQVKGVVGGEARPFARSTTAPRLPLVGWS